MVHYMLQSEGFIPLPLLRSLWKLSSQCIQQQRFLQKQSFDSEYTAIARAAIFNHCGANHWCATNGLQVCCESLGQCHMWSLGMCEPEPPPSSATSLSIVKKMVMCLDNFCAVSVFCETKTTENRWARARTHRPNRKPQVQMPAQAMKLAG